MTAYVLSAGRRSRTSHVFQPSRGQRLRMPSMAVSGTLVSGASWASSHAVVPAVRTSATSAGVGPNVARRKRCRTGSVVVVAATIALGATVGEAADAAVAVAMARAAPPPSPESTRRRAGAAPEGDWGD